jgi:hypothetical protein
VAEEEAAFEEDAIRRELVSTVANCRGGGVGRALLDVALVDLGTGAGGRAGVELAARLGAEGTGTFGVGTRFCTGGIPDRRGTAG